MLDEINGSNANSTKISDEELAKRLQAELNGESEDERLARQLQQQWNSTPYQQGAHQIYLYVINHITNRNYSGSSWGIYTSWIGRR